MTDRRRVAVALLVVAAGTAGLRWWMDGSWAGAVVAGMIPLIAGPIVGRATQDARLSIPAGLVAGAFVPLHAMSLPGVAAAGVVALVLGFHRWPRRYDVLFLALLAAAGAFTVGTGGLVAILLGALAGLAVALRPSLPTVGQIHAARALALSVPAAAFAILLALSAATGLADDWSPATQLQRGIALAGTLSILTCALLGLSVLLESDQPLERAAWNALVLSGVFGVAFVAVGPASSGWTALGVGAAPIAVLASLAVWRLSVTSLKPAWMPWLVLFVSVVAQAGWLT